LRQIKLRRSLKRWIAEKGKKNAMRVALTGVGAFNAYSLSITSSGGGKDFLQALSENGSSFIIIFTLY
jgi:hypothetical protein